MPEQINILIIDDNSDDRESYIRALKKVADVAYVCLEADDGRSGLEIINSKPLNCVLLDYSLPGNNGLQVLSNIRAMHPFLTVIILTGQGDTEIAIQSLKVRANDYLVKSSASVDVLHHTITRAIEHSNLERRTNNIYKKTEENN